MPNIDISTGNSKYLYYLSITVILSVYCSKCKKVKSIFLNHFAFFHFICIDDLSLIYRAWIKKGGLLCMAFLKIFINYTYCTMKVLPLKWNYNLRNYKATGYLTKAELLCYLPHNVQGRNWTAAPATSVRSFDFVCPRLFIAY